MRVLVLFNEPADGASAAERDVLSQVAAIQSALDALGCETQRLGCTLDLSVLRQTLCNDPPGAVFNLVEALGGTDRLMPLVTLLLDSLGLPYTGAGTRCLVDSSDKLTAKRRLRAAGLPTPDWIECDAASDRIGGANRWHDNGPVIVKPIFEHASCDIDDASVQDAGGDIGRRLAAISQRTGRPHFAERFIEGREFNLSLLAAAGANNGAPHAPPEVLPPAEIDFSEFAPGKPRIVGHAAKWDEDSFEYQQTPRRFDFCDADHPLLSELKRLAAACWDVFDVRGYARVDFRVDAAGQPWILEVNANPCLSPDAGFAAALAQAEIPYAHAVGRILADARRGHRSGRVMPSDMLSFLPPLPRNTRVD